MFMLLFLFLLKQYQPNNTSIIHFYIQLYHIKNPPKSWNSYKKPSYIQTRQDHSYTTMFVTIDQLSEHKARPKTNMNWIRSQLQPIFFVTMMTQKTQRRRMKADLFQRKRPFQSETGNTIGIPVRPTREELPTTNYWKQCCQL